MITKLFCIVFQTMGSLHVFTKHTDNQNIEPKGILEKIAANSLTDTSILFV